jgi:hypothetical protein
MACCVQSAFGDITTQRNDTACTLATKKTEAFEATLDNHNENLAPKNTFFFKCQILCYLYFFAMVFYFIH